MNMCKGLCINYNTTRRHSESIYDLCVRCRSCDKYIPRDLLIEVKTKTENHKKFKCPCCDSYGLKGMYRTREHKRLR